MAICPFCSQKSRQLGEPCSCGAGYTVHENHGEDSLGLLGTMIANKFIPVAVVSDSNYTVYYEAFQPAVDRTVSLIIIKNSYFTTKERHDGIFSTLDRCSAIKQQNTPILLEVIDLPEKQCFGVTYEAIKGEPLLDYLRKHSPDPVALMHIIHQLLQSVAAHHLKGVCFPRLGYSNLRLTRSGNDDFFLKLFGILNNIIAMGDTPNTPQDDVYYIGQIALSMMTGKPMPIETLQLPPDRSYMLPIAQIFMRAIAPVSQRFSSCVELLQAFETAFDLNSHESDKPSVVSAAPSKNTHHSHSAVTLEQIVWMHRPPQGKVR